MKIPKNTKTYTVNYFIQYPSGVSADEGAAITLALYKNGQQIAETTDASKLGQFYVGSTADALIEIGGYHAFGANVACDIDASIDEVSVYTRALTAEEVTALYANDGVPQNVYEDKQTENPENPGTGTSTPGTETPTTQPTTDPTFKPIVVDGSAGWNSTGSGLLNPISKDKYTIVTFENEPFIRGDDNWFNFVIETNVVGDTKGVTLRADAYGWTYGRWIVRRGDKQIQIKKGLPQSLKGYDKIGYSLFSCGCYRRK